MLSWYHVVFVASLTCILLGTKHFQQIDAAQCPTQTSGSLLIMNCSNMENNCDLSDIGSTVHVLDCSFNSLKKAPDVSTDSKLSNLVSMNLSHNAIDSVDDFIEQGELGKLIDIDLSFNRLSGIPKAIERVETLKLESNIIKSLILDSLADWKRLKSLSLRDNVIETVASQSDEKLTINVQRLDLSSNRIQKINSCSLSHLRKLQYVDLSNNSISEIETDSFKWFENLVHLDLSSNKIRSLPSQLFQALVNLKYLNLSNNILTILPDTVPMMEWFDISFNRISAVPESHSHVLYPQTVFLIGGNPLDCTCDLLWLKELYDTREYLLKYNRKIDPERFIPACQSPKELNGETWDNLGDDSFQCSSLDKEDLKLTNEKIEEVLKKEKSLTAVEIGQNYVDLKWHVSEDVTSVELTCRTFGKSEMKKVVLPATVNRYRLKKLDENTPYIVCLVPDSDAIRQECVEVMTQKLDETPLLTMEYIVNLVYSHRTLLALCVGFLSFAYAMIQLKDREE